MVVRRIRVKIRSTRFDYDFAQQLRSRKLVERVVNGRQGDFDLGIDRFAMKLFGGDVPVVLSQARASRAPAVGESGGARLISSGQERGRKVGYAT